MKVTIKEEVMNIPDVTFKMRVRDESIGGDNPYKWEDLNTKDMFLGKKVVVFSLPGAFTPTCSNEQCPAYEEMYDEFKAKGIDEVYCISVNDAFVMNKWFEHLEMKKVKPIPDGNGDFTGMMDMMVMKREHGFGPRSWRYAMIVDDGQITDMFEEAGKEDNGSTDDDPYEVSSPENVIKSL